MKIKATKSDRIFDVCNVIFMVIIVFVTAYPVWFVFVASFTENTVLLQNPGMLLWPRGFTTGAYEMAFRHPLLMRGYRNTLFLLFMSLPINMTLTLFCGYFMASRGMMFRKPILIFIMFTMWFSAGMIPIFLNIQSLGLLNSLWSIILMNALSVFNALICKTAIEGLPQSLTESAYIDGANDLVIVFRIVFPLIMPTVAVLLLFYGVQHWNAWFWATVFIRDHNLFPIQNLLRAILIEAQGLLQQAAGDEDRFNVYAETVQYAAIVITVVPILAIYPFLQRFFVKGVLIGAVKG
ncbi:MAG: carbohydrate ABC transporter permease [Defluviitaleaceae bacterium]|nr:carbohydrate ABC transporter permease [Defluviitaleaceae bacterium]